MHFGYLSEEHLAADNHLPPSIRCCLMGGEVARCVAQLDGLAVRAWGGKRSGGARPLLAIHIQLHLRG
eukprot:6404830-Pyramimonas_sp.AAC.1